MPSAKLSSLAKINLDLRVISRRPDGFHDLRSVFQTISLADSIEVDFEPARRTSISLSVKLAGDPTGEALSTGPENLIVRAAEASLEALKLRARVEFRLTKRIPMGAGLGGGSSNAASVLLALPALAGKAMDFDRLSELGGRLGSDVPFFLTGGTALVIGRGTELYPLGEIKESPLALIAPQVHVSTAEAYQSLGLPVSQSLTVADSSSKINEFRRYVRLLGEVCSAGVAAELSRNDFEAAVFRRYPQLKKIHRDIGKLAKESGGAVCRMTGSGSALFCLYADRARRDAGLSRMASVKGVSLHAANVVNRRSYRSLWRKQLKAQLEGSGQAQLLPWPLPNKFELR